MPASDATIRATYTYPSPSTSSSNSSLTRHAIRQGPDASPSPKPGDGDVSDVLNTGEHMAYVVGVGQGLFAPDKDMTRAEVAQMLYNLLLDKDIKITRTFPDVPEGAWYATAVNALASIGVVSGCPDGNYYPADPVTRAEFVSIAVRFTMETLGERQASHFIDVPETHWAHDSIVTATNYGWIYGVGDGLFAPDRHMIRAEVVALTNRMLLRAADKTYINDGDHSELIYYLDVPQMYWAYFDIEEASNAHAYVRLEDGGEEWTEVLNTGGTP